MGRKYQVISTDGHVETPPEPWVNYVDERHRNRAPRLITLPDGKGDAWIIENQGLLHTGQNLTGRGPVKFAYGTYFNDDGTPVEGAGDGAQRLREQDLDGIDAEVLFPPIFATRFIQGLSPDAYRAMVQGYNTFLAEEYCAVAPDRLLGVGYIPISGIDDAVAELERCKKLGLRAVTFRQFPNGSGSPAPEDDRFWEKALELDMPLAPHVWFGDMEGPKPVGPDTSGAKVAAGMTQHCAGNTPAYAFAQMIIEGVFDRFPELRLYFAEVNCALLPGMLYYMDRDYYGFNDWFEFSLKKDPSEYVLEHAMFGMIQETVAVQMAAAGLMPFDWLMWGSDFPHSVGTYPNSRKYLDETFAGVDEAIKRKIVLENPVEFFRLDMDADLTETPAA